MLSVVIPAFEEGLLLRETLASLSSSLQQVSEHYEIIVVDDGSRDNTFDQIKQANQQDPRIKGLRLSRNFGKEAALLAGLRHAHSPAVITMDADLQHPPALIPDLYQAWRAGARIVHAIKVSKQPKNWLHNRLSQLFNTLFSHLSGLPLTMASDYKLLDQQVVHILTEQLPERTRFMRGLSCWVGFPQTTLPFAVPKRRPDHNNRWGYWKLTTYALRAITAFSFLPLTLLPILAILLWLAALLLGQMNPDNLPTEPTAALAFLTVIILSSSGCILLGLAVIGLYLANIYRELQQRPPYLIAEKVGLTAQKPPPACDATNGRPDSGSSDDPAACAPAQPPPAADTTQSIDGWPPP